MKELKGLLQVKKLIALLLTIVFCALSFKGQVTAEQFLTVFSLVIAFYFGQSTARQAKNE
ncbi:hypothetical protein [Clostridium intestinale]|uniref:Phage exported protein n=2 Tax=Clostridium intestinale TaxID=36845 RepID=A0A7D6VRQ6_9CLOT|nr:hypothetical protein [Clostridium intestinale]QLY78030.1 hypothetical protein HZF06_13090 [Clostridium intestinale]SHH50329.1 hypothetical protein SAMN02745941_00220 [Clostridium intestinale DSM 6191]